MLDQEQEFESKKKFLLSKLPEYLKAKGINIESNFNCLNPNDQSRLPSMKYDAATNTVKCINCNTCYNIFDLIGIDHNLSSYSQQFAKAYELYVGKLPIGFVSILSKLNSENQSLSTPSAERKVKTPYIQEPVFEIADEHHKQNTFIPFGHNDSIKNEDVFGGNKIDESRFGNIEQEPFGGNQFNQDKFGQNSVNPTGLPPQHSINAISPFDEARLHPFNSRNSVASNTIQSTFGGFGAAQNIASSIQPTKIAEQNPSTPKLNEVEQSPFQTFSREDTYDYSAYIQKCCDNNKAVEYFNARGITTEIIKKFRLGFDDSYAVDGENNPDSKIWKAAIIPYGTHGYVARNTENNDSHDRYIKKGFFNIYNNECLDETGTIFITEGEIDALSLESLGMHAISLGGVGNIQLLMEKLRTVNVPHHYYICLDNDVAGEDASNKLGAALFQSGLSFNRINLAYPYKDINEALCKNKEHLQQRLSSLEKILTLKLDTVRESAASYCYINNSEDLSALRLSPALYSFSGQPMVLRRLCASLMKNTQKKCIYAACSCQRNALESIIKSSSAEFNKFNSENIRFIEYTSDNIISSLISGVGSMIVQGHTDLITFIDLTSLTEQESAQIIRRIEEEDQVLKVSMILLCNMSSKETAEGICIQNLNIDISEGGEFTVKTINEQGRPAFFIKSSSL